MTDQQGTTLPRVKNALITAIQARRAGVAQYDSPTSADALMGSDGSGYAVFWSDEPAEASVEINVIQNPLRYDETVTVTLILQALARDTDDTQYVVDQAVAKLLGDAIAVTASDPSLGLAWNNDARNITVVPKTWSQPNGITSQNLRGSRIELNLEITACIYLENT